MIFLHLGVYDIIFSPNLRAQLRTASGVVRGVPEGDFLAGTSGPPLRDPHSPGRGGQVQHHARHVPGGADLPNPDTGSSNARRPSLHHLLLPLLWALLEGENGRTRLRSVPSINPFSALCMHQQQRLCLSMTEQICHSRYESSFHGFLAFSLAQVVRCSVDYSRLLKQNCHCGCWLKEHIKCVYCFELAFLQILIP